MAETILMIAAPLIAVAFLLPVLRVFRGPEAVDRVVSIAGIVLSAVIGGRAIYLDVALVYALLSFLGVIVAARYLEGGEE